MIGSSKNINWFLLRKVNTKIKGKKNVSLSGKRQLLNQVCLSNLEIWSSIWAAIWLDLKPHFFIGLPVKVVKHWLAPSISIAARWADDSLQVPPRQSLWSSIYECKARGWCCKQLMLLLRNILNTLCSVLTEIASFNSFACKKPMCLTICAASSWTVACTSIKIQFLALNYIFNCRHGQMKWLGWVKRGEDYRSIGKSCATVLGFTLNF